MRRNIAQELFTWFEYIIYSPLTFFILGINVSYVYMYEWESEWLRVKDNGVRDRVHERETERRNRQRVVLLWVIVSFCCNVHLLILHALRAPLVAIAGMYLRSDPIDAPRQLRPLNEEDIIIVRFQTTIGLQFIIFTLYIIFIIIQ